MLPLTSKTLSHPTTMSEQPRINPKPRVKPNPILSAIGIMLVFTFLFVMGWFLLTKIL